MLPLSLQRKVGILNTKCKISPHPITSTECPPPVKLLKVAPTFRLPLLQGPSYAFLPVLLSFKVSPEFHCPYAADESVPSEFWTNRIQLVRKPRALTKSFTHAFSPISVARQPSCRIPAHCPNWSNRSGRSSNSLPWSYHDNVSTPILGDLDDTICTREYVPTLDIDRVG